MAKFLLLLNETPAQNPEWSPEEMQAVIARYRAWRESLGARILDGQKLCDEGGRLVRPDGGAVRVLDGPYTEAKEVLGGFFALEADSYEEAVEVAKTCPHLANGWITVRQIDEV
ncbi:MAG TPA: YciI family protein [Thermoanaerobaculia bacterium]|nr:YciI family protein [Thermoanaerobaculia bacterium]